MRRRRPTQTIQVNVRLDSELVRQLETHAKESRTTLSEEIRARIIDSLDPKPEPSLWGFLDAFGHRVRDIIEHGARKDIEAAKDIETAWGHLQAIDAKSRIFYTDIERELFSYVQNPKIRELLRGAVTLPDEIKSRE